ncbi:hypothetical protein SODALDRAFT_326588 [Sodiomyces alkalinus F11]|uniref:CBF1-interacting co-repressor CIR N-terminal domain-containing protein n=1 Tax=Sodiomyces alkalinus (strain CBS 110278 / VKM F-3762 / F11) TaxID=1314773 RepID=A0A3N2Q6M8_SODAK|nr:hypothetical protein SODALDRAFT_326588 [Sodiomyces alkalinus F11]ROT42424.1 hypothetical protein SODALDRAFT_326588 [Sodiomyces alkalinus F11]
MCSEITKINADFLSHLLGKKSWNVYNADNIARVRRDEAAAKAAEEAEEQRMQEVDAERRLAILRGEMPPPLPPSSSKSGPSDANETRLRGAERPPGAEGIGRERKKRKRVGEDDTDFEMRIAKERAVVAAGDDNDDNAIPVRRSKTSDAPLVDRSGHIDLFGAAREHAVRSQKNEEAEREAAKKKRELEDQYTMRFVNAAGKDGLSAPWYSKKADVGRGADTGMTLAEDQGRDVWGNEDPGRKTRDSERIVASDPLAMMKKGAARVREVKKERANFEEERQRELKELRREEKRRERYERRERRDRDEKHRNSDGKHRDRRTRPRHKGRRGETAA